jgi:hypothetical protein
MPSMLRRGGRIRIASQLRVAADLRLAEQGRLRQVRAQVLFPQPRLQPADGRREFSQAGLVDPPLRERAVQGPFGRDQFGAQVPG